MFKLTYIRSSVLNNCSVKQFMTLLIIIFVLGIEQAKANKSCSQLFTSQESNTTPAKWHNKVSQDEISKTDRAMMGPLGQLFDLKVNEQTKKIDLVKNTMEFTRYENEYKDLIKKIKTVDNTKYEKILESVLDVEELTENTVIVRFDSDSLHTETREVQAPLLKYFQSIYFVMVNWKYRISGLMKNDLNSHFQLFDDTRSYANELMGIKYNLVYDKKIWEVIKSNITIDIDNYYAARSVLTRGRIGSSVPFLPLAGMAEAQSYLVYMRPKVKNAVGLSMDKTPVELKRYFKNDLEDPLGLLNLDPSKNEFLIRNRMIYKMIEKLPEGTPLEIHAHTAYHVKAYAKWGFVDVGLIKSEKFKDTEVHLLTATREEMLLKIKAIIDKNQ